MDTDGNASDSNDATTKKSHDFIVTGSLDDSVKIWDIKDDRLQLRKQLAGHSLGVVSVAISNDGQKIASSSLDSGLYIVSSNLTPNRNDKTKTISDSS